MDKLEQFITGNVTSKRGSNYSRNPLSKAGSACSPTPEGVNFHPNFDMATSPLLMTDSIDSLSERKDVEMKEFQDDGGCSATESSID